MKFSIGTNKWKKNKLVTELCRKQHCTESFERRLRDELKDERKLRSCYSRTLAN
uniref:Uncharacterized protein n=1 Tax=Arion vulgaris TaxID=1028688 RepID=A0A0B7AZ39_9EUPU